MADLQRALKSQREDAVQPEQHSQQQQRAAMDDKDQMVREMWGRLQEHRQDSERYGDSLLQLMQADGRIVSKCDMLKCIRTTSRAGSVSADVFAHLWAGSLSLTHSLTHNRKVIGSFGQMFSNVGLVL